MRARQKVSRAGVELIKSFEGLRSIAARLPDGRWTLGYGHTFSAREGARVTQEDADALLRFDLLPIVDAINNMVLVPLNQNQFDALVSFCFNIGVENFAASSVLKCINEGRATEAALAMDSWRSAEFNGQTYVLAPLIRRRAAEKNLFLTPEDGAGNAPSLMIRPMQDMINDAAVHPSELTPAAGNTTAYPMAAPGFSPYAQPAPAPISAPTPERQVIDLNSFQPRPAEALQSPYATPYGASPYSAPREQVVEHLPNAIVSSSVMREAPVTTPIAEPPAPTSFDAEPQMSPAVQAALARAQQELRLQEELRQQEEQRLRDETQRQAEAMAAARVAEEMRLQAERMDAARLEQARQEQARLEAERLERERAEQQQRAEQARIEHEAFERVRVEREMREREESERVEKERQERELTAAQAASLAGAGSEDAEKQRKAEAAAALMRLYSPYGAGALGRPLTPAATPPAPPPAASPPASFVTPAPVAAPEPQPEPQGFSNQSVITPQSAQSAPIEPVVREEPAPVQASEDEDDGSVVDFTPIGSPRTMPPPTIVALNPYASPVTPAAPVVAPAVVEVPRPAPVDLSATPQADIFAPKPAAQPVHWRDQLQRPLPENYDTGAAAEQASLINQPATQYDSLYHDDNEEWTMDGGRIAVASDDHEHPERNVWQMIMDTLWWILISGLGLGCLGVAAAAYTKSHDPAVIRGGFFNDYTSLSLIMAAVGILFVSISVWLIMKRLGGLKD